MFQIKTKLGEDGQIVIPPEYLHILGLEVGDTIILRLEDGEMRIITSQKAIRACFAIQVARVHSLRSSDFGLITGCGVPGQNVS